MRGNIKILEGKSKAEILHNKLQSDINKLQNEMHKRKEKHNAEEKKLMTKEKEQQFQIQKTK